MNTTPTITPSTSAPVWRRWSMDLLLAMALAAAGIGVVVGGIEGLPRIVFGGLLAVLVPGYAVTEALLPRRDMGAVERLLMTCALGLCVAIVGGLVLHVSPWGLQPLGWAVFLSGVTAVACIVAGVQRLTYRSALRRLPDAPQHYSQTAKLAQAGIFGLAAVVLVAAAIVSYSESERRFNQTPITQLWMLPDPDTANRVSVGIRMTGETPASYRLQVLQGGVIVHEWSNIQLKPGDSWQEIVPVTSANASANGANGANGAPALEAVLYRSDAAAQILRRVTLKLNQ